MVDMLLVEGITAIAVTISTLSLFTGSLRVLRLLIYRTKLSSDRQRVHGALLALLAKPLRVSAVR